MVEIQKKEFQLLSDMEKETVKWIIKGDLLEPNASSIRATGIDEMGDGMAGVIAKQRRN